MSVQSFENDVLKNELSNAGNHFLIGSHCLTRFSLWLQGRSTSRWRCRFDQIKQVLISFLQQLRKSLLKLQQRALLALVKELFDNGVFWHDDAVEFLQELFEEFCFFAVFPSPLTAIEVKTVQQLSLSMFR